MTDFNPLEFIAGHAGMCFADAIKEAYEQGKKDAYKCSECGARMELVPAAQQEQYREFIKLTVRNSNGKPYYSIIYLKFDDNGVEHDFEGYSSYSLDVISDYLKQYFMPNCGAMIKDGD